MSEDVAQHDVRGDGAAARRPRGHEAGWVKVAPHSKRSACDQVAFRSQLRSTRDMAHSMSMSRTGAGRASATGAPEPSHKIAELPDEVREVFDGFDPASRVGLTAQLITTDADGWARIALLSVGEVLALDRRHLRIALWSDTHSTTNITRTARATLALVHGGAGYTIRLRTCRGTDLVGTERLAVFDGEVAEVQKDVASYAVLQSGIIFDLLDREAVLARWRATLDALGAHGKCDPAPSP